MFRPTAEQESIAYKILAFYEKQNGYDRIWTNQQLRALDIQNIVPKEDGVEIHLSRPGLLIGPKGKNIKELEEFLGCNVRIVEVFSWYNILYSMS